MTSFQRHLAIAIGINQYQHGIAPLQTAVQDAHTLAATLKDDHHYQVIELLDGAATLSGLKQLFEEKLPQTVTGQDCLLIYFAGHGIAKEPNHENAGAEPQTEGPVGYLIPQDARPEDEGTFLPMQEMYRALEKLPCRHFLLILDCCFAGAFRWASTRDVLVPEKMYRERFERFQTCEAWQVLTSASHDQKALDILRDNRGMAHGDGDHSPFAAALFEALTGKDADYVKDNVITATELYLYLRDFVETNSKEKQTPGLWPLPKHNRGEFFFLTQDFDLNNLDSAPILDPDNNPYRGLKAYEERHGNLFFGRDKLIKSLYTDHIKTDSLTVVVGASGTGKSSLVKAGLVPYLKNKEEFLNRRPSFKEEASRVTENWRILPIVRPGNDPLSALAQMLLPLCQEPVSPEATEALRAFQAVVETSNAALPTAFLEIWAKLAEQPKAQMMLVLDWAKTLENRLTQSSQTTAKVNQKIDQDKLEALTTTASACVQLLKQKLKVDDTPIQDLLAQWLSGDSTSHILLVIDQAEELITQSRDEGDRKRFIDYLESALAAHPQQLHCVLTVRMDFEPLVMQLFSQQWQKGWTEKYRMVVSPMNQDDLRQAIEGPANEEVLHFEPASLVDELINEVVQMPGALPLLSFVLSELYIRCFERFRNDGDLSRALTQKDYGELGKVSGALRSRANKEFDHAGEVWGEAGQRTMRNIMLRMVAFEGGELARRRVPKTELEYSEPEENERVKEILDRLIEQRLVISGRSAEGEYVEPAHDALVRGWEKIAEWLKEEIEVQQEPGIRDRLLNTVFRWKVNNNRKNLKAGKQLKFDPILQRQVTEASEQWLSHRGQAKEYNYLWTRDPRLAQLRQVQRQEDYGNNWLNHQENGFVKSSIDRKDDLFRRWVLGTTGVLALIVTAAGIAVYQGNQAVKEARNVQKQRVQTLNQAASAYSASDKPFKALLEATKAGNLIQQHSYLAEQIELIDQTWFQIYTSGTQVKQVNEFQNIRNFEFSSDGKYFAWCGSDGVVKLWRTDGTAVMLPDSQHKGKVSWISFSPDDQYLVSGGEEDGVVKLWRIDGSTVPLSNNQHDGKVGWLSFSPDSKYIASSGEKDGVVKLWRIDGSTVQLPNNNHQGRVNWLSFSPNSKYLASAGYGDGLVKLWEVNGTTVQLPDMQSSVSNIQSVVETGWFDFSPDSQHLAYHGGLGLTRLWHADGTSILLADSQHEGSLNPVGFSPDGQYVAFIDNNSVKLWRTDGMTVPLPNNQHEDLVKKVSFSSNGQYIASIGDDSVVKLWQVDGTVVPLPNNSPVGRDEQFSFNSNGQYITQEMWLDDLTLQVDKVIFSSDDKYIASVGDDGLVTLWQTDGTAVPLPDNNHEGVVEQLIFSPNSQHIASGGHEDGVVKLWQTDGTAVPLLDNQHDGGIDQLIFSPDGKYLASGGGNGDVRLWQMDGTALSLSDSQHEGGVARLIFSSDGQYLVSVGERDGRVKLWKIHDTAIPSLISNYESGTWLFSFSPNEQYIASSGIDNVKLWRTDGTAVPLPNSRHEGGIWQLTFSPDSNYIASGGGDGVKLWQTNGSKVLLPYSQNEGRVGKLVFSLDSRYIASIRYGDGAVKLWRTDGTFVPLLDSQHEHVICGTWSPRSMGMSVPIPNGGNECRVWQLIFSPDGQYLASGGDDGVVKLWRTDGTAVPLPDSQLSGGVNQLSFSPDGQYIASVGLKNGNVNLWQTDGTVVILPSDNQPVSKVRQLIFSPDGQYLVSSEIEGSLKLWRTDGTAISLPSDSQPSGEVNQLVFSPDGQYLASGESDGLVKLWRTDGTAISLPPDSQSLSGINQMVFSPDWQYLASGRGDGVVNLWRTGGRAVPLPYNQHEGSAVWQLIFSPNNHYFVSRGSDGVVKIWPLELNYLIEESCNWLQFYINAHPEEREDICPNQVVSESSDQGLTTSFSNISAQLSQAVDKLPLFNRLPHL